VVPIVAASGTRDLLILRSALVISTSLQAMMALFGWWNGGTAMAGAAFVNPNHLAAFLTLGFFCAVSAPLSGSRMNRGSSALWSASAGLHLLAIAALESRGAALGIFASGLLLVFSRWGTWGRRGRLIGSLVIALFMIVAGAALAHRFARSEDPFRYHRIDIWRASLGMLAERPLLGGGPGMFPHQSGAHNFPTDVGPVRFGRSFTGAHGSFLTLAVEDGAPVAVCVVMVLLVAVFALRRCPASWSGRGAAEGVGLALLALLVQGLVEDLHLRPAIVLIGALLAGVGLAARSSAKRRQAAAEGQVAGEGGAPSARGLGFARGAAVMLAAYLFCVGVALPYLADREAQAAKRLGGSGLARMERAARLNPYHPEYQHDLAMAALNSELPDLERFAEAAERLERAEQLKSIDYRFPLLLARLESRLSKAQSGDESLLERATTLYARAVDLAPRDPRPLLEQAGHLSSVEDVRGALKAVTRALELEPHFRRAKILKVSILLRMGFDDEAREGWEALHETDAVLEGYRADSSYAADLVADAPHERREIDRRIAALPGPGDGRGTH
jgi:hypothetical protein